MKPILTSSEYSQFQKFAKVAICGCLLIAFLSKCVVLKLCCYVHDCKNRNLYNLSNPHTPQIERIFTVKFYMILLPS